METGATSVRLLWEKPGESTSPLSSPAAPMLTVSSLVTWPCVVLETQLHFIDTPTPAPERNRQQQPRLFVKSALTANGP
ncbi:hypothetical protein FOQG_04185 [Fusarium oxysporum f. sp. raphani 54005]|uniref:Uncharacterized protein n=1 Tax=Fusarium oxysporum f. sp. raphani 54005 TaxID=1089458 RepID=X0CMH4_FUSOX|nr:hypothetical protein FOQG_04185 [Fusarium oxysporum f. sp. raphani 54005]